jgi:ZIP family zinc transporter
VLEATLWALVAASSLLLGAVVAFLVPIERRRLGFVMAFGAGVLISAVSYELVADAVELEAEPLWIAGGFVLGAVVFYVGDVLIDRWTPAGGGGGLGIVLGAVLDGIPESVVIGVSLLGGETTSLAVIVAVFLSNVPESMSASVDLVEGGWARSRVLLMWAVVVLMSGAAAGIGYAALEDSSASVIGGIEAFAAGAILTMLADEMIPEAFESAERHKTVGLALAFGFALSAGLSFRT